MTDWKDVADALVKNGAPALGSALGTIVAGPGGAAIGQQIGRSIADRFGVRAEPAVLVDVAHTQTDAVAKLDYDADLLGQTLQFMQRETEETQKSYRAELVSGSPIQKYWRPLNGYVLAISAALLTLTAIAALFLNKTTEMQVIITALLPVLAILGGVVGVSAWGRSREKTKVLDWHGRT